MTLGHVGMFEEARNVLLREPGYAQYVPRHMEEFACVLGYISLNGDGHVRSKMKSVGCQSLNFQTRRALVQSATQHLPWLTFSEMSGLGLGRSLAKAWPNLRFVHYSLNGADDVAKYRKWTFASAQSRYFTVGRPGHTGVVRRGMESKGLGDSPYCILGPDMPDISSTRVRKLLEHVDEANLDKTRAELCTLLHESVADACLASGVFRQRRSK